MEVRGRACGMGFGQGRARPGESCLCAELLAHEGVPNDKNKLGENAADAFKSI